MTTTVSPRRTILAFLGFYALCLFVQFTGSYFTMLSVGDWYQGLNRSELNPPGPVFGMAWTLLYALMALAATRVWRIIGMVNARPLRWWLIQLLTGWVWTMVFFGMREIELGFAVIVAGWVATLITFVKFRRINHIAGWLLLPLLLWITFATYLNGYIAYAN